MSLSFSGLDSRQVVAYLGTTEGGKAATVPVLDLLSCCGDEGHDEIDLPVHFFSGSK